MPRSQLRTRSAQEFLRGPKIAIRKRGKGALPGTQDRGPYVTEEGDVLNIPASRIAWTLTDLHIAFEPEAKLGPARALGGGLVDFLIEDRKIALEYQGPFHETDEGGARDYFRRITREQAGYITVYIYEHDLYPNLHARLLELLGNPMSASIVREY